MPKRRANGEGNIRKRKDGRWEGRYTAGYDANGKADDAANPTVLQRAAQERSRAEEKPAGAERTWPKSSHGAVCPCGAEQGVGVCSGRKIDPCESSKEMQNSEKHAQRDEHPA